MTKNEIELRIRAMREELENGITVISRVEVSDIMGCCDMTYEEKVNSIAEMFYLKTKSHKDTYYKEMSHDWDKVTDELGDYFNSEYGQMFYDATWECHERLYKESRFSRYDDLFPPIRIARESEEMRDMLFRDIRADEY